MRVDVIFRPLVRLCSSFMHGYSRLVGKLEQKCSLEEASHRESSMQLDIFEKASQGRHGKVDPQLAVKKYQRSAADKKYRPEEIRTPDCCWETMCYLMGRVFDTYLLGNQDTYCFDEVPEFYKVYSFLADRSRAVLVDLQLQECSSEIFILCVEMRIRFELLSSIILQNEFDKSRYCSSTAVHSFARTMQPLLEAYRDQRELRKDETYISKDEPKMVSYNIAMFMRSTDEIRSILKKIPKALAETREVATSLRLWAAFVSGQYDEFLEIYSDPETDILLVAALRPYVTTMRLLALWSFLRSYPRLRDYSVHVETIRSLLGFRRFVAIFNKIIFIKLFY